MVRRARRADGKKLTFLAGVLGRGLKPQLRADFRRVYHVSYDEVARLSVSEAADLAAMLPAGSLTMGALDASMSWPEDRYMLARIANDAAVIAWNAKGRPGKMPRPFGGPAENQGKPPEAVGMDPSDIMDALAGPRE